MTTFAGRVALVTGGARGLGVEVSRQLAQAGFTVWLTARDVDRAVQIATTMDAEGDVRSAQLDVADQHSVDALSQRIEHLDVLVNNAAIDYDSDARAMTETTRPAAP